MAIKFVILAAALACANAGLIGAPLAAAPVAHYSAAPAVSSSYIHQASPAVVHAAPVAAYAQAAPIATYAHAAPIATYAQAAPLAVHAPAIGSTHQSVLRSLGGNQAVSTYSKAVDSAFSSVRKFDTRITNDALSYGHGPIAVAHAAPVATYAQAAPLVSSYAAHSPALIQHAAPALIQQAAPALISHAAPVASYAAAAPVLKSGLGVAYSPAAVVSHATFTGLGAHYAW